VQSFVVLGEFEIGFWRWFDWPEVKINGMTRIESGSARSPKQLLTGLRKSSLRGHRPKLAVRGDETAGKLPVAFRALSPPPAIYIARNMQMQERGSLMEVTGITPNKRK
jgi:hypothetical protein